TPPVASIIPNKAVSFCLGDSVILSANTGTGYTYQWQLNGSNIPGSSLTFYTARNEGNYRCLISNTCGSTLSNGIEVNVDSNPPSATITPTGTAVFCSGSFVTLYANSGAGLNYQWQLNGTYLFSPFASYALNNNANDNSGN